MAFVHIFYIMMDKQKQWTENYLFIYFPVTKQNYFKWKDLKFAEC
jgi:hypothetical protein